MYLRSVLAVALIVGCAAPAFAAKASGSFAVRTRSAWSLRPSLRRRKRLLPRSARMSM